MSKKTSATITAYGPTDDQQTTVVLTLEGMREAYMQRITATLEGMDEDDPSYEEVLAQNKESVTEQMFVASVQRTALQISQEPFLQEGETTVIWPSPSRVEVTFGNEKKSKLILPPGGGKPIVAVAN